MNLLDTLPPEILDIIFNDYWRNQFKLVVTELNYSQTLNDKIYKFLNTYCFKYDYFNPNYLHYLKEFNIEIYNLLKKPINKIICKNNNLYLQYCFNDYSFLKEVDNSLKLVCIFSINCSSYMRYRILHKFKELSNMKYTPIFVGCG